uniref:GB1/RHD3-type G domain-containing protein n=1 Tax=Solanum lycopersicum TaxID=4081 RepID=A0A3Q7GL12_SOLLC
MWSSPLRRTTLDGTEYNLLLLDTEGIDVYDQTGTYSTQIFSLAVLLSSTFVYNQVMSTQTWISFASFDMPFLTLVSQESVNFLAATMEGIDEAVLDRLSLITEMTTHIRVRASGGRASGSSNATLKFESPTPTKKL